MAKSLACLEGSASATRQVAPHAVVFAASKYVVGGSSVSLALGRVVLQVVALPSLSQNRIFG